MEQVGDVFYKVEWHLGFGPGYYGWGEDCDESEIEPPTFEMETYRVRSVRKRARKMNSFMHLGPSTRPQKVTAFALNCCTVDNKGNWLPRPDRLFVAQWTKAERPSIYARSKAGAYRQALAEIRSCYDFDPVKHKAFIGRIKAQQSRARGKSK